MKLTIGAVDEKGVILNAKGGFQGYSSGRILFKDGKAHRLKVGCQNRLISGLKEKGSPARKALLAAAGVNTSVYSKDDLDPAKVMLKEFNYPQYDGLNGETYAVGTEQNNKLALQKATDRVQIRQEAIKRNKRAAATFDRVIDDIIAFVERKDFKATVKKVLAAEKKKQARIDRLHAQRAKINKELSSLGA